MPGRRRQNRTYYGVRDRHVRYVEHDPQLCNGCQMHGQGALHGDIAPPLGTTGAYAVKAARFPDADPKPSGVNELILKSRRRLRIRLRSVEAN